MFLFEEVLHVSVWRGLFSTLSVWFPAWPSLWHCIYIFFALDVCTTHLLHEIKKPNVCLSWTIIVIFVIGLFVSLFVHYSCFTGPIETQSSHPQPSSHLISTSLRVPVPRFILKNPRGSSLGFRGAQGVGLDWGNSGWTFFANLKLAAALLGARNEVEWY